MAALQTSNYLPDIQQYLDAQAENDTVALEVVCGVCWESKLDISQSARMYAASSQSPAQPLEAHGRISALHTHGFERTVALPCGHVFGNRCMSQRATDKAGLTCPACDFRMAYESCGHAIAPALIPVRGVASIRDTFPLTIPEGGRAPRHCKECRWQSIRSKLRYALSDECAICRLQGEAQVPHGPVEHDVHRVWHLKFGLGDAMAEIVSLVWPEFATRETESSAEKATADGDRRRVNLSLLNVIIMSEELEDRIWQRTQTKNLSREQLRKHAQGVGSIEQLLLSWLMESRGCDARRTW